MTTTLQKLLHAHKKNSYYTLVIFYCTFCVKNTQFLTLFDDEL